MCSMNVTFQSACEWACEGVPRTVHLVRLTKLVYIYYCVSVLNFWKVDHLRSTVCTHIILYMVRTIPTTEQLLLKFAARTRYRLILSNFVLYCTVYCTCTVYINSDYYENITMVAWIRRDYTLYQRFAKGSRMTVHSESVTASVICTWCLACLIVLCRLLYAYNNDVNCWYQQ